LSKKIKEFLSMDFKGKDTSEQTRNEIMKPLWFGDLD
jgi:hypothetical protein